MLKGMVSHGRVELLLHPLCQKYLEFKWNSYGACAYAIRLIWGLLFLTCVTLFSSVVLLGSDERKLNGTSSEPTGRYLRKVLMFYSSKLAGVISLLNFLCSTQRWL